MSYILDALKKSEQQRGHGNIPDVQTVHSSSLNYRDEKRTYWPYILIVAILLNLAAIVYFILDKESDSKNISVATKNTGINEDSEKVSIQNTISELAPIEKNSDAENLTVAAVKPKTKTKLQTQITTSLPEKKRTPNNNSSTTTYQEDTPKNIVEYYDLPESLKRELPTITVSAHIYSSNPIQRSIVINNKFLEEGDYILDDLTLHEITPDGAILDYHGTRFNYGVVSGWQ